ncbi:SMP-30/gluconolactonase/LRE family protein [Tistrella mobilis]|uniref:SMP-30/gluconolactonase/LRE family protein n=1 Tax=Tistrella mobilis TaxID=171437 RepID=UPI003558DF89
MSWFPPPAEIRAEVFTSLPAGFRAARPSAWADANKGGEPIDSFLEGPSFDREGRLWVTDIPHGRVFRIARDGSWEQMAGYDGWPNGLKITADGRILIADYRRGLLALDTRTGEVTTVLGHVRSESFKGINDLVVADDGAVYFTDQGQTGMQDPSGRVYRLSADGRLERLLDTGPSPNGIALCPAGRHLYVAMTRACQIWRMPVTADGVIGKANVFAHTPGGTSGPDGLAVDAAGGLAIANPGHGCVWLLDAAGVPRHRVVSPTGTTVTNLAYDPDEPDMLYMTCSDTGEVLRAQVPVRGLPLVSHRGGTL